MFDHRVRMILFTLLLSAGGAVAAAPVAGERPPEALGRDRDGHALQLADYAGRVVVLSFWASWCAPCLDEMALLENLQKRIGRERLAVIGINWREDLFRYRAVLRQLGEVQIILGRDVDDSVGRAYGVSEIPRLFVIGRDGRLASIHAGFAGTDGAAALVAEIEHLIDATAHEIIAP